MASEPTPQPDFVPDEVFIVEDLDTLKVLADPLRLRIRELMAHPTTVKQVATELGMPPTKLYYHINLLEKHELIVLVDTCLVSGIIEKHYQISARRVQVAKHLLSPDAPSSEGFSLTINTFFETARNDLMASMRNGAVEWDDDGDRHKGLSLHRGVLRLTDEQAAAFYHQVESLFHEYVRLSDQHEADAPDTKRYRTFYTLFPLSSKRDPNAD